MNKRFLLAIGICFVFYILWLQLGVFMGFVEPEEPVPAETKTEETAKRETTAPPPIEDSEPELATVPDQEIEPQEIVLENEEMRLVIDNRGGLVREATLKKYYNSAKRQEPLMLISSTRHFPGEVLLENGVSTKERMFTVEQYGPNDVTLRLRLRDGELVKRYTLEKGFALRAELSQTGAEPRPFYMVVSDGLQPVRPTDKLTPSFWDLGSINPKIMQLAWSENGDHENRGLGDLNTESFEPVLEKEDWIEWAGVKDTYFANVFLLDKPTRNVHVKGVERFTPGREKPWMLPVMALRSEDSLSGVFYMGPIEKSRLESTSPALSNLITYGWAGLLSKWLFVLLQACYGWTGNWGWAIVILTFFLRVALVPMMIPSIKSSLKMRKIQPKIEKLRQKFTGQDLETKQKLSQETFKLYKQEGVNPFSSCVTALAQMPIFIAYFSLLRSSISLRQAEWMFWIEDLSIKDPTYVLPIIMGVTMFLSTLAMPMPSADPAQQKMMKVMPVLFSLMFIAMPSGLILYMITSNMFSMGQTYFMKWRLEKS